MNMTTMHTRALAIVSFIMLGCGSAADDEVSNDAGDAGVASDAGSIVVPAECEASGTGSISSEITFQFVNQSDATLWIGETCSRPLFSVFACLDDYATPIGRPHCNECSQTECLECPVAPPVCEEEIAEILPGESFSASWQTNYYSVGRLAPGSGDPCACYTRHPAPPGLYRVRTRVYTTEPTAGSDADYEVERAFELPTDGPIELRVDSERAD